MDLMPVQIQGFFDIPVDNLFATPVLLEYIKKTFPLPTIWSSSLRIRAGWGGPGPSARGSGRVSRHHRQAPGRTNEAQVMNIIGNVKGKKVLLLDDMVDTAGTVVQAAKALRATRGPSTISVCCTIRSSRDRPSSGSNSRSSRNSS
jgi:ribose-phosphate pyrophosphokinase